MSLQYFGFDDNKPMAGMLVKAAKQGCADYRVQADYFGGAEIQGKRETQEDRVSHFKLNHAQAAQLAALTDSQKKLVLSETYQRLNAQVLANCPESGSTGITCLFYPAQGKAYFANLGDSELLKVTINQTKQQLNITKLNTSHGLDDPEEIRRVREAGHKLFKVRGTDELRLESGLNMGRAFGDQNSESYGLIHEADIGIDTVEPDTLTFYVVACDGLTEANQEEIYKNIAMTVYHNRHDSPDFIAQQLCKLAFDKTKTYKSDDDHSWDNISVLVTQFPTDVEAAPYLLSVFDGHAGSQVSTYLQRHIKPTFALALEEAYTASLDIPNYWAVASGLASLTTGLGLKAKSKPLALGSALCAGVSSFMAYKSYQDKCAHTARVFLSDLPEEIDDATRASFEQGRQAREGFLPWLQVNLDPSSWGGNKEAYYAGYYSNPEEAGIEQKVEKLTLS